MEYLISGSAHRR